MRLKIMMLIVGILAGAGCDDDEPTVPGEGGIPHWQKKPIAKDSSPHGQPAPQPPRAPAPRGPGDRQ